MEDDDDPGRKDFVLWYLRHFGVKRLRRDNSDTDIYSVLEPAPQGMGAPQSDQGHARNVWEPSKSTLIFQVCESTFEVVSAQSAPDLPHPQVEAALSGIFLFPNEPISCQILNLKKIVCLDMLSILHWTA